jgi:hypothetical protein
MPLNSERRIQLNGILPEGMVIARKWLLHNNFDRHAIDNLVKTGQLEPLANGVFKRPNSGLTWQGLVSSLQQLFSIDVVVGGITSLELQGFSHYLPMSAQTIIHLYSGRPLPKWVHSFNQATFIEHRIKFLSGIAGKNFIPSYDNHTYEHKWAEGKFPLFLSIPERAILEVLEDVPEKISFEQAEQLMQGMTTLSPGRITELLTLSRSLKAKRLFLWFSDRQAYPWLQKIERDKINLGKGKRRLAKEGKLDKKYLITVPRNYE